MIYHGKTGSLDDLDKVVRKATKKLRPHKDEWDSIAVTGISGVVIGVPVSMRLKKPLVIVRKQGESIHSSMAVNHKNMGERVLFLDDFVCGGGTRKRVKEEVTRRNANIVAQYVYQTDEYTKRMDS